MKPTILLDQDNSASDKAAFSVEQPVMLFQTGLGAGEKVEIQILTKQVSLDDAVDGDWDTLRSGGSDVVLDPDNTYRRIEGPGQYRAKVTTAEATWRVGIY